MSRHSFIIVVPVADRPQHIRACLASLRELLRRFPYDRPVTVLIADDSVDPAHVADTAAVAAQYRALGIPVIHFTPDEQAELVARLGRHLPRVLGPEPHGSYGHKGQGVMRNIAYLKVAELLRDQPGNDVLIWSLDSDQEFQVKLATPDGDREDYVVDFLHGLDAIFSRTDARVLTGKVVGDPPVSAAVMIANFLEDVIGFLDEARAHAAQSPCAHHAADMHRQGEAAYHDMAELFGFKPDATYRYRCILAGTHSEADCFAHFASRLNSFFYGEHPTRVSYYVPDGERGVLASVQPARTVYAGNYVFRPAALKHFIPFAPLRLRMSGPTLGRLLKAELGPRFVSANLPMLHRRTVESGGQSEFRPGIATREQAIDLSGEFERQFYGDVMLFSIERLTQEDRLAEADFQAQVVDAVRAEMLAKYDARQHAVLVRLDVLEARLNDPAAWWHDLPARHRFESFAANVRRNFAANAQGPAHIHDTAGWLTWRTSLLEAIRTYPTDRTAWEALLCAR